jgi:AcrR family transcriptional regulator
MTKAAALHDPDHLLDVAASVFRRAGYGAATLRQICAATGLRMGSLHYRYATKEDLLQDLMARAIERLAAAVRAAVSRSSDPAERLRLGLRAHLTTVLSEDDSFYVLLYDWRSLEQGRKGMLKLREQYERVWDELLQAAVDAGFVREGVDVKLVRQFGFGAMNWVAQWHASGSDQTPEEIADAFWSYFAFGLLADKRRASYARLGRPTKSKRQKPGRKPRRPGRASGSTTRRK